MKYCKDCIHCVQDDGYYERCDRKTDVSKVTGVKSFEFCDAERFVIFPFNILMNCCGNIGMYYKAK